MSKSTVKKYSPKSKKPATQSITDFFPIEPKDNPQQRIITTYTDGSTVNNGKINAKGGYGVFFGDNDRRNISEPFFIFPITNNRCELYGCIQALQILGRTEDLSKKATVIVHTDSEYIVNSMTKWLPAWKARGWKKADKKPVENVDLLYWLDKLIHLYNGIFNIKFQHVNAAHDYDAPKDTKSTAWQHWHGNNQADILAKNGTEISVKLGGVS